MHYICYNFAPCPPSFMMHKGQQRVNLANWTLTLIVPFVIYYFCSILQMTSIHYFLRERQ